MKSNLLVSLLACYALFALPFGAGAVEPEHQETRNLIDFVTRAANLFEQDGIAACKEFKTPSGPWLLGDAYIFVLDFEGKTICHPARPSHEGRRLVELRDPDGKPIIELIIRQLAGGAPDGWVHYLWPRPGQTVLTWKSSYVRRARSPDDGAFYIVGSGLYQMPMEKFFVVDRVEEAAELLADHGTATFATLRDQAGGFLFLDAYVFVMSLEGIERFNPAFPELEGRNVLDIQDREGKYPAREMLKRLENQDAGWVRYYWPRPNEQKPSRKEAFVKKVRVGEEVLIVGAGVYYD